MENLILPSGLNNFCEDLVSRFESEFKKEKAKELKRCWLNALPQIETAIRVRSFLIWQRNRITQKRLNEAKEGIFTLPDTSEMNDIELAVEEDWRYWFYTEKHDEDIHHIGLFRDAEFFRQVNLNSPSLIILPVYPIHIQHALSYEQRQMRLLDHYFKELNNRVKRYTAEAKHVIGVLGNRSLSMKALNTCLQDNSWNRGDSDSDDDSQERLNKLLKTDSFAKTISEIKATELRRRGYGSDAMESQKSRQKREGRYVKKYRKTIDGRLISDNDPEQKAIAREEQSKREKYLNNLPQDKLYAWTHRNDMTQEEIAKVVKCDRSTISIWQSEVRGNI